jgi:hypothetical protein
VLQGLDEDLPNAAALEESNALALAIVPESELLYDDSGSSSLLAILSIVLDKHQRIYGLSEHIQDGDLFPVKIVMGLGLLSL